MLTHVRAAALCVSVLTSGVAAMAQAPAAATEPTGAAAAAQTPGPGTESKSSRKITKRVTPTYPVLARRSRLTGRVKLELAVSPDGKVLSVKTVGGNPLFEEAAGDAAKQWKFEASPRETTEIIAFEFVP